MRKSYNHPSKKYNIFPRICWLQILLILQQILVIRFQILVLRSQWFFFHFDLMRYAWIKAKIILKNPLKYKALKMTMVNVRCKLKCIGLIIWNVQYSIYRPLHKSRWICSPVNDIVISSGVYQSHAINSVFSKAK